MEFTDDYEHLDSSIEYTPENILFEPLSSTDEIESNNNEFLKLKELFYSSEYCYCNCLNENCSTIDYCKHAGNYKRYKKNSSPTNNELILTDKRPGYDLIYECTIMCKCNHKTCENRLVQYGPRKNLQIIVIENLHSKKGLGLITTQLIPQGAFVCEYAGEILTKQEAERRHKLNQEQHLLRANSDEYQSPAEQFNTKDAGNNIRNAVFIKNYIICLNEYSLDDAEHASLQMFIDPTFKGNIGRYLNHSCNPNCEIISVRIEGSLPKLSIFTKRIVEPFEELCFHYGGEQKRKTEDLPSQNNLLIECLCGEINCEKYLPNLNF